MNSGKAVDIGAAFNFGIERLKANPGMTLGFGGAMRVLTMAFSIAIMVFVQLLVIVLAKISPMLVLLVFPLEFILFSLIYGVVFGALMPGFFNSIERDAKGEKSSFGDLFRDQSKFLNMFVAVSAAYFITMIGSMLCVLPGLVLTPILPISAYLVWKGDSGFDALKKSFSILFSNLLAGLYLLIAVIVSALGLILCVVGIIATVPIAYAAAWHLCKQLCDENPAPSSETPAQL